MIAKHLLDGSAALVAALFFCASSGGAAFAQGSTPLRPRFRDPHKPNIIVILADDLGCGDLGCYGQRQIKTPHLDQLAAEGMRFTQCYAGSPFSAPSRAALLTGLDTAHLPSRGDTDLTLPPQALTVADILRGASYRTAAVGEWGLGLANTSGFPLKQGFEEWFGFLSLSNAQNYYPTRLWRNESPRPIGRNLSGAKGQYVQDLFTLVASNYVRVTKYVPFFLYLAYTIPRANTNLAAQTGNGMETPSDLPYSAQDWPQPEKNKAAMISRLDADVGALLGYLQEQGIAEQSLIFFSSDNGPHQEGGVNPAFFKSTGPFRGGKGQLYEGAIRVPMIVRWPGRIKPGTVSDQVWAFWDFLPTVRELIGLPTPTNSVGISILPTLLGDKQTNQHDSLYWESHQPTFQQALRTGDWKAVRLGPDHPLELYNLSTDPGERTDLAAERPEVAKRLEALLERARIDSED